MAGHELAQLNVAILNGAPDSPAMLDFRSNIARINRLAEAAPGFVWRPSVDDEYVAALQLPGQPSLVNLSVWRDVESLRRYVYESGHVEIMRRRREWFERAAVATLVLWWVPPGHRPGPAEVAAKLALLRERGPTAAAFTFRQGFPPPQAAPAAS
jgi:hypothetical protein